MYPNLYQPQDITGQYYNARIQEFTTDGLSAGLRPAHRDSRKVALILVDMQWDFVHPDGYLSVPGSLTDTQRVIDFIYRNVESITSILASMDTHRPYQIFFPPWWKYADTNQSPTAWTEILYQNGRMVDHDGRDLLALIDPRWSVSYLQQLTTDAQKNLMIWPYHCIEGSQGHSLMPALIEALAFYSAARKSQAQILFKGRCPQVEHYGIFMPEVIYSNHPDGGINEAVLQQVAKHDLVYVAGEAKSHCVLATMKQLVKYFSNQPEIIRRLRFLTDCTSSVKHPNIDFEGMAMQELQAMQRQGIQLVTSTDPIG